MKLYATVTSERATKGQGGNEFLEIEITTQYDKKLYTLANLQVTPVPTKESKNARLFIRRGGTTWEWIPTEEKLKGKRQKGECLVFEGSNFNCKNCGTLLARHK